MTKEDLSLLLFLETCAVDQGGGVDVRHMNSDDQNIAEQWHDEGFISFGRLPLKDCAVVGNRNRTHYVVLSDEAWAAAHTERKARAARMWEKRSFGKSIDGTPRRVQGSEHNEFSEEETR